MIKSMESDKSDLIQPFLSSEVDDPETYQLLYGFVYYENFKNGEYEGNEYIIRKINPNHIQVENEVGTNNTGKPEIHIFTRGEFLHILKRYWDAKVKSEEDSQGEMSQLEGNCSVEKEDSVLSDSRDIWSAVANELAKRLKKPSYDTWIRPTTGKKVEENKFLVLAPNEFARDWIAEHYQDLIVEVLTDITGKDFMVEVVVDVEGRDDSHLVFSRSKLSEEAALGYMLLTCEEVGVEPELVNELHKTMRTLFEKHSLREAERTNEEWMLQHT